MRLFLYSIPILVLLVDLLIKFTILNTLQEGERVFGSLIDITLYKNLGITGSFYIPQYILLPLSVIIIGLFLFCLYKTTQPYIHIGLFFIICGAIGNFLDRLLNSFTTDYILFFEVSVINLSDILIIFGILVILLYSKSNQS